MQNSMRTIGVAYFPCRFQQNKLCVTHSVNTSHFVAKIIDLFRVENKPKIGVKIGPQMIIYLSTFQLKESGGGGCGT